MVHASSSPQPHNCPLARREDSMPELKNARWERFAQLRAKGCSLSASYNEAYDKPAGSNHSAHGSRLGKRPILSARIQELRPRSEVTSSEDLDPEFVIQQLLSSLRDSVSAKKFSASNRTLELLGKYQSMWAESKNSRLGEPSTELDGMSADEIRTWMVRKVEDLCPDLVVIKKRATQEVERSKDRASLVSHFVSQLKKVDPEITVFDPKEVPAEPTEHGGTASSELH